MEQKITIIGAGPGGASTALELSRLGIPCLLLDKAIFPREKICGGALSGKVLTILKRINPDILNRFEKHIPKKNIWGIRMFAPNKIKLDFPFKWDYKIKSDPVPGYTTNRVDFDKFLIDEVRNCKNIDFIEGVDIVDIERSEIGFKLKDKQKTLEIETQILIVANGANSSFSRHYAGIKKVSKYYAAGVRAYFDNVTGFHEDGFIELHFLKEYLPGYFWIFPLPDNRANVGLGIRSDYVSKRKTNLKKTLIDITKNHPAVKHRFENASITGKIEGHPLPLGSKKYRISGDHYMLVGDAGHLIDPTTGEGIGYAIYSGWIAAQQAAVCLDENNFTAKFMKAYDKRINRVLGIELRLSYKLQKLLVYPKLINLFASGLEKNQKLSIFVTRMFLDLKLRKQLFKPRFWISLLLGRL